jgi:protein-S-isoprenylcysteine O-methyltransferase
MTRPLPFVWPYALVFWLVYAWGLLAEFGIVRRARYGGGPVPREDRGSTGVIVLGGSVVILLVFVLAGAARWAALPGAPQVWFMAGLALLVGGSLLRRHCFRVLGRFFTGAVTIQDDHRVVDSGAYRWVRHPSYTAALLMIVGIAVALGNGLSVAVAIVGGLAIYTYRARVEEQALLAALGAPYAEFMAKRKRFLPFVV